MRRVRARAASSRAPESLRASFVAWIVDAVEAQTVDPRLVAHTFVGQEALAAVRAQARARLVTRLAFVEVRLTRPIELSVFEELGFWLAIRRHHSELQRASVDPGQRADAFGLLHPVMADHAASLGERLRQPHLRRAILRWLRAEAVAVGRDDAVRALDGHLRVRGVP
ncbi:MAG: hypothetical protein ABMB14_17355 [Myxococcota bacterium]